MSEVTFWNTLSWLIPLIALIVFVVLVAFAVVAPCAINDRKRARDQPVLGEWPPDTALSIPHPT